MSETEKSLREMLRHNAQEVDLLRDEIERLRQRLRMSTQQQEPIIWSRPSPAPHWRESDE